MAHETGTTDTDSWQPAGRLTIEGAAQAHADAAAALGRGVARVDLSAVERIDTAGCQVLLKMAGDARAQGLDWQLSGGAPDVLETIQRLGCDVPLARVTPAASPGTTVPISPTAPIDAAAATVFEGIEP
jgi:anti-anti-sigma regulatory factor